MSLTIRIPKKNSNPPATEPPIRRKSNRRRVTTDSEEDDYEPSPPRSETKPTRRLLVRTKDRAEQDDGATMEDEHNSPINARDRAQPSGSKRLRDDSVSAGEADEDVDVSGGLDDGSAANAGPSATTLESVKDESASTSLPPFKKRRLPPIRKNKPGAASSSSGPQNHLASGKAGSRGSEAMGATSVAEDGATDVLPLVKRPKRINNAQEVNLNDRSVYESLFKNSGSITPRAGVNLKEKEERRKELDKMREEDRARRAANSEHVFNLRSQHDKIMSFVDRLQARRSGALWPNILAVAFRQEREREERRRDRARLGDTAAKESDGASA
ncbi:hypothetical protein BC834DRAFT_966129 [Gloeopeniophorella convolvens]|nr:hypothetical protein BC834DRAFT_966129 [Gloeopeniophorella convolvens]